MNKNRSAFDNPVDPVEYTALTPQEQERVIQLQQTVLEDVALDRDHVQVIEDICRLAESAVPDSVASCMLLNDDGDSLYVLAAPSVPAAAVAGLNGLRPGPGGGSCGNAVFRAQPVFVENTLTDPRWCDVRRIALDFDIRACWSMPIRTAGGKAIGSFALSCFEHRQPGVFQRTDSRFSVNLRNGLVRRLARGVLIGPHDVSFALNTHSGVSCPFGLNACPTI